MQVKVRHGATTWQQPSATDPSREVTETAFRGMIVDMPESEVERLEALGAVVPVGTELPLGGRLTPIPSTASDAELVAWTSVANRDEIIAAIKENPALGDRILAAYEIVQRQLADQNELLGGLVPEVKATVEAAEEAEREAAEAAAAQAEQDARDAEAARVASEAASAALLAAQGDVSSDDELEDPNVVVSNNVSYVTNYLSKHPDQADAIMSAENLRAENATNESEKQPRVGVIHAVEAAAGHTS